MRLKMMASVMAAIVAMGQGQAQNSAQAPVPIPGSVTQQATGNATQAETIHARTQVVLLDVVATDHAGHPVTDLKREDFTVLEQGKSQQIASFNMVDLAKHTPLPGVQDAAGKLPPGVYGTYKTAVGEQQELTVLLLDALNTPWAHQAYARYEMLKYLEKHHPTGHTAVYALNTTLLRLQDFTDDPEVLKRAIKKHKGGQSPLLDNPVGSTPESDDISDAAASAIQSFEENQASFQYDMRVRMTLEAFTAIGRQLAGYAGRKKLIWVSGGFPIDLSPGDAAGFASQRNYADDITTMTTLLRESQVSVYTIDAAGLTTQPIFQASESGRGRNGRGMTGPQLQQRLSQDSQAEIAAHLAAKKIADDTGGLAFYNRNDLDTAIMKSVADGAEYYALSYAPIDKNWDGRFRKIEVKVNRPGVELRYRKGYIASDPDRTREESQAKIVQDITPALNTLLTSSSVSFYGSAFPLPAPAATGSAPPASAVKLADIRFLVEPRDILFQPVGDKKHCSLEFVAAAFEGDKLVQSSDKKLNCNLEPKTYAQIVQNGMLFRMPLEVTEGKIRIRLLVRDNLSGKMGTVDVPYPPVLPAQAPAAVVPPVGKP
jgi:VWFA-related protein